jgi:hypothetical protein
MLRIQVSGVRKKNIEAETCWSEAEIPSEAKRQRGTLKPETSTRARHLYRQSRLTLTCRVDPVAGTVMEF